MGTQCVDRCCLTKIDPCRSVPRPFGRRIQIRSLHYCRPPRLPPAVTQRADDSGFVQTATWTAVSFGQLVAAPSAQFALRNGHQNNLRLSRHIPAIKPAGDENHNTIGHLILSNQEPRSHFTTSLRNTSERRFTLRRVDIPTQVLPTWPHPCTF